MQFPGAMSGTDAACDLLLQPLQAFSDLFKHLASLWIRIVGEPDLAGRVYLRTNLAYHFEAGLENRIRLALGLSPELLEGCVVNIPSARRHAFLKGRVGFSRCVAS